MSDSYLCSAAGFAAAKRWARTPLAASYGATLLFHSEALKTLFLQLVDQTFIENLFHGSVCYRATQPLSDHLHADAQPFPANEPGWKSEHAAKIVIGIVLNLGISFIEPLIVGRDADEFQEPSAFAWCGPNKQRENCRVGENYWRDKETSYFSDRFIARKGLQSSASE